MKRRREEGNQEEKEASEQSSVGTEEQTEDGRRVEKKIDWQTKVEELAARLAQEIEGSSGDERNSLRHELSRALRKLGKWQEALDAARDITPATLTGMFDQVKALIQLGRTGEALSVARDAVIKAGDDAACAAKSEALVQRALNAYYAPMIGDRPVRVQDFGNNKGKGLIALRDFKQGEDIFNEEPLVCAPPFFPPQEKPLCCSNCMRYFGTRKAMLDRMVALLGNTPAARARVSALPHFEELCPPFSESDAHACERCEMEVYCGDECKNEAWQKYHEVACPAYASLKPYFGSEELYDMAVMSLRIYAVILQNMKNAQAENLQGKLKEAYMPFMHFSKVAFSDVICWVEANGKYQDELVGGKSKLKEYKKQLVQHIHASVIEALSLPEELRREHVFSWENLDLLLGMVATNVQKITSPLQRYAKALQQQDPKLFDRMVPDEVIPFINAYSGQGLFSIHNCMNHSCDSNAETTFRHGDRTATVYAVKDIKQGEEICIDYIGARRLRWSAPRRRRRLQLQYRFDCACGLCHDPIE